MSDETNEEVTTEETPDETGLQNSQDTTETESQQSDTETEDSGSFDAAALEAQFGMPSGALADCEDSDSATEAIREFVDKTLIAGLTTGTQQAQTKQTESTAEKIEKSADKKEGGGNAEYDKLRAELDEVKNHLSRQQEQYQTSLAQQLEERIEKEIDSWKSPKYGVSGSRNYKQTRAANELRSGLLRTHIAGLQATGQPISQVEVLLRRVRAFDDENFAPAKNQAKPKDALGTPGGKKATGADSSTPQNIHFALMGNKS